MRKKRLFSAILAAVMFLSLGCTSVSASELTEPSEHDIDVALVNRGYPQLVVDSMSLSAKKSIYDDTSLYFKSAAITTYEEDTHTFTNYNVPSDGVMPLGQLPEDDLDLLWSVNGVAGEPNLIKVVYSYKWKKLPFFRWQDTMSVSWNQNLFEIQSGSFYKVDKFNGQLTDPNTGITNVYINDAIHSEEHRYANGSPSGISWYADLKGYIGVSPTSLYGHGEFILKKLTSRSGSSTLYGHYVHPQVSVGMNVIVTDWCSFSVSATGLYDECGNDYPFDY